VTAFVLACLGLVLLSGLFLLLPQRRSGGADEDLERANLEWYRLRRSELAEEGADALQDDARLRLLEDEQQAAPVARPAGGEAKSFPVWILLPVVAVLATLLYYQLGAAPDVMISRQLSALDSNSGPEQMQALIDAIEKRSQRRPDNLEYTALLGQYYMGQQQYARAAETYAGLAQLAPEDAQSLAFAAQAEYLASGRQLTDRARLWAEQSLAIQPHQRTALGLLGMVAFEQQQYREAIGYWQRLLAMEQPGSEGAQMITGVIEAARQRLGEGGGPATVAGQPHPTGANDNVAAAGAVAPGVTVRVTLPEGARVAPADTVFVLARNADSDSRMPIAVQRLRADQLPLTLRLDDSNSMAGQKLSAAESVLVVVQLSPDGRPGEANATWLGQAGPLAPTVDTDPLEIQLQPRS
jgi:cytochrome c-type biogenesis protein CcmH